MDSFFAAPFASDGELVGIGSWHLSDLSPKWLGVCEQMLIKLRPAFHVSPGEGLAHIAVKLTSTAGAGLGTFLANDEIVASTAYLRGTNPAVEKEMLSMFLESVQGALAEPRGIEKEHPFQEMLQIDKRPLHIVIAWANPKSEEDENVIAEFSNHFAAAYLCLYDG